MYTFQLSRAMEQAADTPLPQARAEALRPSSMPAPSSPNRAGRLPFPLRPGPGYDIDLVHGTGMDISVMGASTGSRVPSASLPPANRISGAQNRAQTGPVNNLLAVPAADVSPRVSRPQYIGEARQGQRGNPSDSSGNAPGYHLGRSWGWAGIPGP